MEYGNHEKQNRNQVQNNYKTLTNSVCGVFLLPRQHHADKQSDTHQNLNCKICRRGHNGKVVAVSSEQ